MAEALRYSNISDPGHYIHHTHEGQKSLHLMVDGIRCAGCMRNIEKTLASFPALEEGRVNMSTKRLVMRWHDGDFNPMDAMQAVVDKGFDLAPFNPEAVNQSSSREEKRLLYAMAVAGFAMANVMMLSFAVWAGAFSSMGEGTRGLFHWLSAIVALPTVVYAGQPFYRSAWGAVKNGHLNMDVPISLAIILASAMSLFEVMTNGAHAYFDAAVSLLFFLLIGRYLDQRARAKAQSAGEHLLGLQASSANVISQDGSIINMPLHQVPLKATVLVKVGEKIPVDGQIMDGISEIDTSMVTGESLPHRVKVGDQIFAGTINLSAPIKVCVSAVGDETLLAEIVRLMENAEQKKGQFVRIADRVAGWYAPIVHGLGLLTFLGWWLWMGAPWQQSLLLAISVLIITCPCALGLAVPVVQVIASGRLMRAGVLLKSGDALERLKGVDTVVFDKTGTLTLGQPQLINGEVLTAKQAEIASSMAAQSNHPLSRAVVRAFPNHRDMVSVEEVPGCGLEVRHDGWLCRLGNAQWLGIEQPMDEATTGPELWLQIGEESPICLRFQDQIRPDAAWMVERLNAAGLKLVLLSGDHDGAVKAVANQLGISDYRAHLSPKDKVSIITDMKAQGAKVLMVGDGLNDAPALTEADVSISPATAADVSQVAADIIFQGQSLKVLPEILSVAKKTDRLVKQNFGLAFLYNIIAIPLAVVGLATPLMAAIAMSSSSILVILNALRLKWAKAINT